jgi:hypothetical protein
MAKFKTNEDRFKDFIKNGDSVLIAIARATMVHNAENIIKNQDAIREEQKDSMFSPDLIIKSAEEVVKYLGFSDTPEKKNG